MLQQLSLNPLLLLRSLLLLLFADVSRCCCMKCSKLPLICCQLQMGAL